MSKILFGGAVWCLVMAIVDIFVWNTFVMEHFGTIKFMDHWETTSVVKLLYLNNAAVATRYRIGRVHSQLPNEAFVLINRTSDSSLKTLYVAYSKIFIAFTWIFFSILMMCSLGHRRRGNFMTYMWGLFTLLNFIGDLIFTIVYVNDLQYASNLNDLVQYIDGILSGAGRANPDTEIAVWIMIFIVFKGALGALINVVLTFFFFTYYRRVNRNVRAEDPPCPYIRGDNATIEMQDYSPRPSPPMHHGPRFVKRTPKQNQEFLALHHPDLYPAQEIEQPSTTSAIEQTLPEDFKQQTVIKRPVALKINKNGMTSTTKTKPLTKVDNRSRYINLQKFLNVTTTSPEFNAQMEYLF